MAAAPGLDGARAPWGLGSLTPHVDVTERGGRCTYDLSVATEMPAWNEIRMLVARELDDPVHDARPLTPPERPG